MSSSMINLDEIAEFGERVPCGDYIVKLGGCAAKLSKAGAPQIEADFIIQEGPYTGASIRKFFGLWYMTKEGKKPFAPGLSELKKAASDVGRPLPQGFAMPAILKNSEQTLTDKELNSAYKTVVKHLGRLDIRASLVEDIRKKDGVETISDFPKLVFLGPSNPRDTEDFGCDDEDGDYA